MEILQNVVAFSEYMNLKNNLYCTNKIWISYPELYFDHKLRKCCKVSNYVFDTHFLGYYYDCILEHECVDNILLFLCVVSLFSTFVCVANRPELIMLCLPVRNKRKSAFNQTWFYYITYIIWLTWPILYQNKSS